MVAARLPGGGEAVQIFHHQAVLAHPVIMQDIPAEQAGIMAVVKDKTDGIIADRLHSRDGDILLAGRRGLLSGAMALNLGRGRFHTQQFGGQREALAALERHMKGALVARQPDFQGPGGGHLRSAPISASLSSRASSSSITGTPARTGNARPSWRLTSSLRARSYSSGPCVTGQTSTSSRAGSSPGASAPGRVSVSCVILAVILVKRHFHHSHQQIGAARHSFGLEKRLLFGHIERTDHR